MARWDYRYLGDERFPATLSALEIEHFFTLEQAELTEVRRRRGPMSRLAVALQVGFIKLTGTLLNSVQLIPAAVLDHVGRQLGGGKGMPLIASIRALYRRRRALFDHQQTALDVLGVTLPLGRRISPVDAGTALWIEKSGGRNSQLCGN